MDGGSWPDPDDSPGLPFVDLDTTVLSSMPLNFDLVGEGEFLASFSDPSHTSFDVTLPSRVPLDPPSEPLPLQIEQREPQPMMMMMMMDNSSSSSSSSTTHKAEKAKKKKSGGGKVRREPSRRDRERKTNEDKGVLDEEARKRLRHNEIESRRRQRMNLQFVELGELVGVDVEAKKLKKGDVLSTAIDTIKKYEREVQVLESIMQEKKKNEALGAPSPWPVAPQSSSGDGTIHVDTEALLKQRREQHSIVTSVVQDLVIQSGLNQPRVNHNAVFHRSTLALDVMSLDGRILDCNANYARLLGASSSQIRNTTVFAVTHKSSLPTLFSTFKHLWQYDHAVERKKIVRATGEAVEVMSSSWIVRGPDKEPRYVMGFLIPCSKDGTMSYSRADGDDDDA